MKSIFTFILLFISLISLSQATITGVTLYGTSAEVSYQKSVSLKSGKNTIVFKDLTPFIVENSIKVGLSDNTCNIITVTERINFLQKSEVARTQELNKSILYNSDRIEMIVVDMEVLQKEKELLFKDKGIGGVSNGVAVSEIEKASAFFNKRYTELNNQLLSLKREKRQLEGKNNQLKAQRNQVSTVKSKSVSNVSIVINSPSSKNIVIDLKLLTKKAGWSPLYDIKYTNPQSDLNFVFRANIFNASNTDWNNVPIKLSTANPTIGFGLPSLNGNSTQNEKPINYNNEEIKFRTIETNNTITTYNIEHKYTIPSDGKPYLIDVDKMTMPSEFSYIIIPKLDNNGFLMANIPNWNNYNLISGSTNVYHNGVFLGKTFLNTTTSNDTLEVFLGKDNKIETYRTEKTIEKNRKLAGNYFIENNDVSYTIKNNYNIPVKIKMLDQVPVFGGKYDKTKMEFTGHEDAEYIKKDGLFTWEFKLQPNETVNREFSYKIKSPKEIGISVKPKKRMYRAISCPSF